MEISEERLAELLALAGQKGAQQVVDRALTEKGFMRQIREANTTLLQIRRSQIVEAAVALSGVSLDGPENVSELCREGFGMALSYVAENPIPSRTSDRLNVRITNQVMQLGRDTGWPLTDLLVFGLFLRMTGYGKEEEGGVK